MSDVTYVLNTWQRPHVIKQQIDAVSNQSIKPNELMIWQNKPNDLKESFTYKIQQHL